MVQILRNFDISTLGILFNRQWYIAQTFFLDGLLLLLDRNGQNSPNHFNIKVLVVACSCGWSARKKGGVGISVSCSLKYFYSWYMIHPPLEFHLQHTNQIKYVCHWKDQHLFHYYKTLKNFLSCKITSSIWGSSSISIKSSFSSLLSLASITSLHARISFIIDRWVTRENIEEKVFFDPTIWTWLLVMMMRWWWIWWQGTFTDKT